MYKACDRSVHHARSLDSKNDNFITLYAVSLFELWNRNLATEKHTKSLLEVITKGKKNIMQHFDILCSWQKLKKNYTKMKVKNKITNNLILNPA